MAKARSQRMSFSSLRIWRVRWRTARMTLVAQLRVTRDHYARVSDWTLRIQNRGAVEIVRAAHKVSDGTAVRAPARTGIHPMS
eukprot:6612821-Alexandrium_andersonii.AAC.1